MRKVFISFMCSIMFLSFTFFLVSCGKKECEHNWDNGVVKSEATCVSEGEMEYTCSKCKTTKTEHTGTIEHKKSTTYKYVSLGHFLYCTVCGTEFEKEEHVMVDLEVQQEPTAYETGIMITKCSTCDYKSTRVTDSVPHKKGADYKSNSEYHWFECEAHEDCNVEIQKEKHTIVEGKVLKEASAYEDGLREIYCTVCDYKEEVVIPALNHRKGELEFDDNEHWYTCDRHQDCEAKIDVEAHQWELVSDSATCTEDGTAIYKCSVCPKTKEEASKANHRYSEDWTVDLAPTCTEVGSKSHHCLGCDDKIGDTVIPATGHSYKDWVVLKDATETETGLKERECSVCGHKETGTIPVVGHVHQYDTAWTVDKEATCTGVGSKSHHCLGCDDKKDDTEIPATGHNYGELISVAPTCTTAGLEAHYECLVCNTYFNKDKEEVTEDSLVIPASHDLESQDAKDPTCTEVGWAAYEACKNCDYTTKEEIGALGHDFSVWLVTQVATLYADGLETIHCSRCDAVGVDTRRILAQADFRNDFNLETADGTWKYGTIDYHWGDETFDFVPATEKNGNNDGWVAPSIEIKNDWMNAEAMVGIAYTVTEDTHVVVSLKFVGGTDTTRLDLRIGVKNSEGTLYSNPSFHNNPDSKELERLLQFNLNAGDTIYFIFSNGAGGVEGAWPNGNLNINLRKPSADYRSDFNLETADGTWKYGTIDYHWGDETFDFVPATEKNGNNDGWVAPSIEIKNDWMNAEAMVGIAYTVTEDTHVVVSLKFVGGTDTTRLDLRIGVKNSEGTLYSNPSFHNNPDSKELERLLQFNLNAGDTIYFIFSNGAGGVEGAWPNGNLELSIF
ncbi:MAG: hypothetical protein NC310_05580 [Roseburia sp.]|nr:hypothetical protein [Anaeroplasma bactoclasticum]MCM1196530.1 hypothetical protein [Roseburia sp.]